VARAARRLCTGRERAAGRAGSSTTTAGNSRAEDCASAGVAINATSIGSAVPNIHPAFFSFIIIPDPVTSCVGFQ
jgi:hypothetical protein